MLDHPLPPDDLRVGEWIAVRDFVDDESSLLPDEPDPRLLRRMRREVAGSSPQPGVPFRVLAVELPWVYAAGLDADGDEVGPSILDVRRVRLVRISPEVPAAIVAFGRKKRDDAADREVEAGRRKAIARARAEFARRHDDGDRGSDDGADDPGSGPSTRRGGRRDAAGRPSVDRPGDDRIDEVDDDG